MNLLDYLNSNNGKDSCEFETEEKAKQYETLVLQKVPPKAIIRKGKIVSIDLNRTREVAHV